MTTTTRAATTWVSSPSTSRIPPASSTTPANTAAAWAAGTPTESKNWPVAPAPLVTSFSQPCAIRTTPSSTRVRSRPMSRTIPRTGIRRVSAPAAREEGTVVVVLMSVVLSGHASG